MSLAAAQLVHPSCLKKRYIFFLINNQPINKNIDNLTDKKAVKLE